MKRYNARSGNSFARFGIRTHSLDRTNTYRGGQRL
uniref:Mobilization protein n=1 Tax=Dulem virus 209 TaxID=3145686 RepID=A0AAU8B4X6_9VIRU